MRTKNPTKLHRNEQSAIFETLPYAGNHTDIGEYNDYGVITAEFRDGEYIWRFEHDESWDNVTLHSVRKAK